MVRLTPNHIDSVLPETALQAWKGVNNLKLPWLKDPFLCKVTRFGTKIDNIASLAGGKENMWYRRVMSPPLARKFLLDQERIFKEGTKAILEKIEREREKNCGKVDLWPLFNEFTFGAISTYLHILQWFIVAEFVYGGLFKESSEERGSDVKEREMIQKIGVISVCQRKVES